jgi:hypothetical protein
MNNENEFVNLHSGTKSSRGLAMPLSTECSGRKGILTIVVLVYSEVYLQKYRQKILKH